MSAFKAPPFLDGTFDKLQTSWQDSTMPTLKFRQILTPFQFRRHVSQRGDSPFVYRDRGGWPASLPYIRKIRVSVAIGTQSGIRLHQRVPMVKIWGSSKNDQNWTTGKLLKL